MIYILIIGIIILMISIIALCYKETRYAAYGLGIVGSYMISGAIMYLGSIDNSPTAMDVYQGKTTLEYTYRNGIVVDSVVVFKEE